MNRPHLAHNMARHSISRSLIALMRFALLGVQNLFRVFFFGVVKAK